MGTPAMTSRGMGPAEMPEVARLLDLALSGNVDAGTRARAAVLELARRFPMRRAAS